MLLGSGSLLIQYELLLYLLILKLHTKTGEFYEFSFMSTLCRKDIVVLEKKGNFDSVKTIFFKINLTVSRW